MNQLMALSDSLQNLVAGLGVDRDKAAHNFYADVIHNPAQLANAYRGSWLPQKIVNIPARDACRKWRNWQAKGVDITKIEAEEKRLGLQGKILQAMIWGRLFGGGALLIGTGDSDASQPLDASTVKRGGLKYLVPMSSNKLQAGEIETDVLSPQFGLPKLYSVAGSRGNVDIHPSRLVLFTGVPLPDPELCGTGDGWGDSVLTAALSQVSQTDSTIANVASLVFEAKVDIFQLPNFMEQLCDAGYRAKVMERYRLAAQAKGNNGTLVMDAEEKYTQKLMQFGSLTDVMMAMVQLVAGAADIPVTRLLGQSPSGLNSSGEADLRNYYDNVGSMQSMTLQPAMAILDECVIRSGLGDRPDELHYEWASLWQTTAPERADIGEKAAKTIKTLKESALLPDEALSRAAVNMLTELGVLPGLESAMEEFGERDFDEDDRKAAEAEQRAALTLETQDAAPRTLYVRRDVVNSAEIAAWAQSQGIEDVADGLHVTIAYSSTPFDWIKAGNAREWAENGKDTLVIAEGGPRAIEPLGGMAAVILFASSQLCWRHEEIIRAGASHDYPDYTPHISLTKTPIDLSTVVPYRGRIVLGPEIFEEPKPD